MELVKNLQFSYKTLILSIKKLIYYLIKILIN